MMESVKTSIADRGAARVAAHALRTLAQRVRGARCKAAVADLMSVLDAPSVARP